MSFLNKTNKQKANNKFINSESIVIHVVIIFLLYAFYMGHSPWDAVYRAFWVSCSRSSTSDGWRISSRHVVTASKSWAHLSITGETAVKPTKLPTMHCYARPLWTNSTKALVLSLRFVPMPRTNSSSMGAQNQSLAFVWLPCNYQGVISWSFTVSTIKRLNIQNFIKHSISHLFWLSILVVNVFRLYF